jgi:lipoyl(octanoyl) transferase
VHTDITVEDLGRIGYTDAYEIQQRRHAAVVESRLTHSPSIGALLLVEHNPVVTVTRRPDAASHITASRELLAAQGVEVVETDRGGDVTYHGPGQLVVYPIVDLNLMNCRIVEYLRVLEEIVIETLAGFGMQGGRDEGATGVWVSSGDQSAKVCAMGVRVRRWVTMHGLAINVDPNLEHFGLIVPCGLHGRAVTSMKALLGDSCPTMNEVKRSLAEIAVRKFKDLADTAVKKRAEAQSIESDPGGSQR